MLLTPSILIILVHRVVMVISFLDAPHDAHCEDVVCGFVVEVRGSWKALISRCRERGGGLLQSSQLRNRNDWSCGAQSCLLMYKHPGSVDIIFLYMFLLVHQGCWNDDVQLMVDFWVLEWADSPCRGIHGSPDAVCQLAATSAQKLCHFWRHAVLQQNPSNLNGITLCIYIYY